MTTIERPSTDSVARARQHDARLRAWCAMVLDALLLQLVLAASAVGVARRRSL